MKLCKSPYCFNCQEFEDVNHYLLECKNYITQRQLLFTTFNNIFKYKYPYHYTIKNILTADIFPQKQQKAALKATYKYITSTRRSI